MTSSLHYIFPDIFGEGHCAQRAACLAKQVAAEEYECLIPTHALTGARGN